MPGTKQGCLYRTRKGELKSVQRMSVLGGVGLSAREETGKMASVAWR